MDYLWGQMRKITEIEEHVHALLQARRLTLKTPRVLQPREQLMYVLRFYIKYFIY